MKKKALMMIATATALTATSSLNALDLGVLDVGDGSFDVLASKANVGTITSIAPYSATALNGKTTGQAVFYGNDGTNNALQGWGINSGNLERNYLENTTITNVLLRTGADMGSNPGNEIFVQRDSATAGQFHKSILTTTAGGAFSAAGTVADTTAQFYAASMSFIRLGTEVGFYSQVGTGGARTGAANINLSNAVFTSVIGLMNTSSEKVFTRRGNLSLNTTSGRQTIYAGFRAGTTNEGALSVITKDTGTQAEFAAQATSFAEQPNLYFNNGTSDAAFLEGGNLLSASASAELIILRLDGSYTIAGPTGTGTAIDIFQSGNLGLGVTDLLTGKVLSTGSLDQVVLTRNLAGVETLEVWGFDTGSASQIDQWNLADGIEAVTLGDFGGLGYQQIMLGGSAIPEPSSIALFLLGGLALMARCGRSSARR